MAVVVVAYESGDELTRCLDSLAGEADELVVVDNGGSLELAGRADVVVVRPGRNVGFGGGCNRGFEHVRSDVVVFLNPDTVARPGALRALAGALEEPAVGAVQARLRLLDRPERLNSSGNVLHVSGLAWPGGYGEPAESLAERREIAYASGAAFAMRTQTFRELGGFAEELFLYQEDLDLCWRARQRGLRVVVEPAADVLHDYVLERPGRRKEYFLERNRLLFVLTAYSARLLVLAAPVLIAVELGIVAVAAKEGWLREKAHGWAWLLRERRWLAERRRRLQAERVVADRELARLFEPELRLPMVAAPPGLGVLNALASLWWRLVRVVL
ncbi:MAG TPA: glycosyltransferase family 2 protein [Gaiellaceae bacterium]|nr:glycosyltransferase family 2 protein [Gaiellaceae bacterium]